MKKALIKDSRVANIVVVGEGYVAPDGFTAVDTSEGANVGAAYSKGVFSESPEQTTEPVARAAERIAAIPEQVKTEAYRRIVTEVAEHQQRNKLADGVELLSKQVDAIIEHLGITDPLTAEELKEKQNNLNVWNAIKRIRNKSNEIENRADLATIDITDTQHWS